MAKRKFWHSSWLSHSYDPNEEEIRVEVDEDKANLVGSCVSGEPGDTISFHMPVIDVDLPCRLVPSETPGHFHLYIDTLVMWEDYKELLKVLAKCGIVEPGYVDASIERGQTFAALRPWKQEHNSENNEDQPT